jgi:hypothetical protein
MERSLAAAKPARARGATAAGGGGRECPEGENKEFGKHARVRPKTTMFSTGKKKGEAFRLDVKPLFILRVKISIPPTFAKE